MSKELRQIFERAPINGHLSFELREVDDEGATVAAPAGEELRQESGVVHGGVLSSLADTAAVYALLPGLEAGRSLTSIEFKLNFLRPAVVGGPELVARSRRLRRGRRVAVCEVTVSQAEEPVAVGLFTYLFTS